jgi:mannosyltransferase
VTERTAVRALIGLIALAAALRFWRIGDQSFWLDEVFTAKLAGDDLPGLLDGVTETESTPHLYYVLAWIWARVFGEGEAALRSLSAVFGIATVPVAYLAARELFRPAVALVAAALVAVNPWFVWYSQEARAYALLMLLATASLLFFVRALRTREPRDLARWALFSSLALLTHYFAAFLVGAEAIWLLWVLRRRAAVAVGALAAVGVALAPLALAQRGEGHTTFIEDIGLGTRITDLPKRFVTGELGTPTPLIGPLAGLLVVAGFVLVWRLAPEERRRALGLAALVAVSVLVPIAMAVVGLDYLLPRNTIAAYIPAAIVVAAGFATSRAGIAAAIALCAILLAVTIQISLNDDLQRDDWRAVAAELHKAAPGDRAIVITSAAQAKALEHYVPGLRHYADGDAPAEIVAVDDARDANLREGGGAIRGFRFVDSRREPSFTLQRYRTATPAPAPPVLVEQYKLDEDAAALRLQPRGYPRTP